MIDSKTRLCCIIGNPVEHSRSPQMHNAAYKALGLNFVFVAFRVTDVKKAINGIRTLGIRGAAVTIPHKVEVVKYVDIIDETAKTIGAINTIVNDHGILKATNTDWIGALRSLEEKTTLEEKRIALLGAGGGARAVAFALKTKKAKIDVFNRSPQRGKRLKEDFALNGSHLISELDKSNDFDIIINTTSVGMEPFMDISPIPKNCIKKNQVVFDIVYTPHETKFIRMAKEAGATIVYGYKMVLYGGVRIFELFTGKKAPIDVMEKALLKNLQ